MLRFFDVHKSFGQKKVLRGINLEIRKGEFVAIIGASGCGKTTLIRVANGFVVPDRGEVFIGDERINYADPKKLREIRRKIGMIYQLFNLVERSSALQNVLNGSLGHYRGMGGLLATFGIFRRESVTKAIEYLNYVGLSDCTKERADRLSGGQKQRVAIARALMQEPLILLADEPIANLDPKTSHRILGLLKRINKDTGLTTVVVIHHIDFVQSYFDRVIGIKDGVVVFDGRYDDLKEDILEYIYSDEIEQVSFPFARQLWRDVDEDFQFKAGNL